ncbi:MAG: cytochrome c, partial [Dehalococcoidia bacterium]|nr:cytochrome c [Dehalococcoidia bacterium]
EAFQKLCDSCHPGGDAGLGPSLLGLDQVIFAGATREGVGSMPAYNTARLSDRDLEAMYAYLLAMAQGPTTPSEPTATPIAGGPPAIPHPLEGRDQCLGCHASGAPDFPQVPEDHAARTNDICTNCHSASVSPAPSPTPTAPVATATPEPEEREKGEKPEEGPSGIPHTLEGRDQCLGCHGSGIPSFPQVPDIHAGRTNDICTLCHSSKG